jgi:hypothetical protein
VAFPLLSHLRKTGRTFVERRRWPRRKPGEGVTCLVLLAGAAAVTFLFNLSEGGACVESPRPLAVGERLTLRLFNRDCLGALTVAARVVWCRVDYGTFRAGLRFERPLAAADLLPFLS